MINGAFKDQLKLLAGGLVVILLVMYSAPTAIGIAGWFNGTAGDDDLARYAALVDGDVEKVVLTYKNITNGAGTGVFTTYQLNLTSEVTADTIEMTKSPSAVSGTTRTTTGAINIDITNTTVLNTFDYNVTGHYLVIYYKNMSTEEMMDEAVQQLQWGLEVVDIAQKADANDTHGEKDLRFKVTGSLSSGHTLFASKTMHIDGSSGYMFGTGDYTVNQTIPAKLLISAAAEDPKGTVQVRIDGFQAGRTASDNLVFGLGFNVADSKGRMSLTNALIGGEAIVAGLLFVVGTIANPNITARQMVGRAKKDKNRGGDF